MNLDPAILVLFSNLFHSSNSFFINFFSFFLTCSLETLCAKRKHQLGQSLINSFGPMLVALTYFFQPFNLNLFNVNIFLIQILPFAKPFLHYLLYQICFFFFPSISVKKYMLCNFFVIFFWSILLFNVMLALFITVKYIYINKVYI